MTAWRWLWISLGGLAALVLRASDADAVFVIANAREPESVAIAREYMALRGVPEGQFMAIDFSDPVSISHREFDQKLRGPLRGRFEAAGWLTLGSRPAMRGRQRLREPVVVGSKIRYLLCAWGVPYGLRDSQGRVVRRLERWDEGQDRRDASALDSELCLLLVDGYSREGPFTNPRFGRRETAPGETPILATARLDGPSPALVRERLMETLDAERRGLLGMALIDTKGGRDALDQAGDAWMLRAAATLDGLGQPVLLDRKPALVSAGVPVPPGQVAVYLGWYAPHPAGLFEGPERVFAPGGIGLHLHSLAGHVPRERDRHWLGALMARGAAAGYGCLNEPYLGGVPRFDRFIAGLAAGRNFGDAVLEASPQISWQTVVLGDPLYRPFAVDLSAQAAAVPPDDPFAIYVRFREWMAVAQKYPEAALSRSRQSGHPMAREFEGLLLLALRRDEESKALLWDLVRTGLAPDHAGRAAWRLLDHDPETHGALADTLRERFGPGAPVVAWFLTQAP